MNPNVASQDRPVRNTAFVASQPGEPIGRVESVDTYGEDEHTGLVTLSVVTMGGGLRTVTALAEDVFVSPSGTEAFIAAYDQRLVKYGEDALGH